MAGRGDRKRARLATLNHECADRILLLGANIGLQWRSVHADNLFATNHKGLAPMFRHEFILVSDEVSKLFLEHDDL